MSSITTSKNISFCCRNSSDSLLDVSVDILIKVSLEIISGRSSYSSLKRHIPVVSVWTICTWCGLCSKIFCSTPTERQLLLCSANSLQFAIAMLRIWILKLELTQSSSMSTCLTTSSSFMRQVFLSWQISLQSWSSCCPSRASISSNLPSKAISLNLCFIVSV